MLRPSAVYLKLELKTAYFRNTLKDKKSKNSLYLFSWESEEVGYFVKNIRLDLFYKINISKSIFEHFFREPIRSLAQKVSKNSNFKKLKLFKIFETYTFFDQCLVSA
jgi:hypothetical protein